MSLDLSVLLPCIHMDKLKKFNESLRHATKRAFEVIVVGPYSLPDDPSLTGTWKYKKDMGSPSRCHNIALEMAEGKYVTLASDDMKYFYSRVDGCLDILEGLGEKGVVSGKHIYHGVAPAIQLKDDYYLVNSYQQHKSPHIADNCKLVNVNFMHTQYLRDMGGLDSRFEHHGVAQVDLAVRLHNDGAVVKLNSDPVCFIEHTDTIKGDHAPIHHAVVQNDEPLFRKFYSTENSKTRARIDIDNWKGADPVWKRRWI
jgi:hypothetical protein